MKPNIEKTDWIKGWNKLTVKSYNLKTEKYEDEPIVFVNDKSWKKVKDFISNLLQQQREDFKQTMANSNEWWNNKLRQQREEIIKEIEGIVGGDTGGTGQVYFYKKQLRKEIRERLKQITNLKEK